MGLSEVSLGTQDFSLPQPSWTSQKPPGGAHSTLPKNFYFFKNVFNYVVS